MPLTPIDDSIWSLETVQAMPGGAKLPNRMLVLRLDDGSLWVYSPVALDDALVAEIEALGPVRHLVAPNCFHHLHMGPASQRWPEAKVYAPAGLKAKRPDLRIDVELGDPGQLPWAETFEVCAVEGAPDMEEFVFLHRPSATLIVCDLVFNIHADPRLMTRLLMRMVGCWKRLEQSKLWRFITKDRAAAGRSVATLLELEFERVIMSHGEIAEGAEVRERLREGLGWMLAAA